MLDLDGIAAVSILVKAGAGLASLVAAGSVLALLGLSRLDDESARTVRRLAVSVAVVAGVVSAIRIPVRASFLAGGSLSGSVDPVLVGMVADSPIGESIWVRLAGLALICLLVTNRRSARVAAAIGAVVVCASFALRGHALNDPRPVLAALVTLHVLGVAFWIGVFAPLHRLVRIGDDAAPALAEEFGKKAVWVVAALVLAGAGQFVLLTGDPLAALSTLYGRILIAKLALVLLLLGCAALNRLHLTASLRAGHPRARSRLLWSIRTEVMVVLAILITTATLTTLASPDGHEHAADSRAGTQAAAVTAVPRGPAGRSPRLLPRDEDFPGQARAPAGSGARGTVVVHARGPGP